MPIGGGDISAAWRLVGDSANLFLKTGTADDLAMFAGEAAGLQEIAATGTLRVPAVLAVGASAESSYLVLEYLSLTRADAEVDRRLGVALASLHRHTAPTFGWHRDNHIGRTPQRNRCCDNWSEFFREQRLAVQFELAARNGYRGTLQRDGEQLLQGIDSYFAGHNPLPSLLHGDLWSGNCAALDGDPVLFDPAVYYGDRETDLAMTRLFGGFSAGFYRAYNDTWPLAAGSAQRVMLYQLYHVLNHLNLFGRAYLQQAEAMTRALLTAG